MDRVLQVMLDTVQPLSSQSTIHSPVVARCYHVHHLGQSVGLGTTCSWQQSGLGLAHSQNTGLGRVYDRSDSVNTEHAQVADSRSTTCILRRVQFTFSSSFGNILSPPCQIKQSQSLSSTDNRCDKSTSNSNSNTDI